MIWHNIFTLQSPSTKRNDLGIKTTLTKQLGKLFLHCEILGGPNLLFKANRSGRIIERKMITATCTNFLLLMQVGIIKPLMISKLALPNDQYMGLSDYDFFRVQFTCEGFPGTSIRYISIPASQRSAYPEFETHDKPVTEGYFIAKDFDPKASRLSQKVFMESVKNDTVINTHQFHHQVRAK